MCSSNKWRRMWPWRLITRPHKRHSNPAPDAASRTRSRRRRDRSAGRNRAGIGGARGSKNRGRQKRWETSLNSWKIYFPSYLCKARDYLRYDMLFDFKPVEAWNRDTCTWPSLFCNHSARRSCDHKTHHDNCTPRSIWGTSTVRA